MEIALIISACAIGLLLFFIPSIIHKIQGTNPAVPAKSSTTKTQNVAFVEDAEVLLIDLLHLVDIEDPNQFLECIHPDQRSNGDQLYKQLQNLMIHCRGLVPQDLEFDDAYAFQVTPAQSLSYHSGLVSRVILMYCNPQGECIKESFLFDFKIWNNQFLLWKIDDSAIA